MALFTRLTALLANVLDRARPQAPDDDDDPLGDASPLARADVRAVQRSGAAADGLQRVGRTVR